MSEPLTALTAGQPIVFGGERIARVDAALAAAFRPGDRLIVVQETGALLRVPAAEQARARGAVDQALAAFDALAEVPDAAIGGFFAAFARRLGDDAIWAKIAAANAADVARARGRSVGRLLADARMRAGMIEGLHGWAKMGPLRGRSLERIEHAGFSVEQIAAPLGVVGFVFEGRPNVLADAAGVIASGNAAVFRIGSGALATAQAIAAEALRPALAEAGLPAGAATLLDSADRAAGWALFSDPRLALAVARGSGEAVAELGAIARQSGVPVSLHGTGGAWLIADASAEPSRFAAAVAHSLDRKVCNTLNVCVIVAERARELAPVFLSALPAGARLHATPRAAPYLGVGVLAIDEAALGREWEWEDAPEVSLAVVDDLDAAIALFNARAPRLAVSLLAEDEAAQARFFEAIEAPFVGDGFTRWVDGQFALARPELGLANWQAGRPLARGAILSGDGVFTVRTRMRQRDPGLRR